MNASRKMRRIWSTTLLANIFLMLLFGTGCASSSSTSSVSFQRVLPTSYQPDRVRMMTTDEYDILYSQKANTQVFVSLRAATKDYMQFFISVLNNGEGQRQINPDRVRMTFSGDEQRPVRMYMPSQVPGRVARNADSDARTAAELTNATGRLYSTKKVTEGRGSNTAYGVQKGGSNGEEEVILKPASLEQAQRATGFVYSPAPPVASGQFILEVPVGDETHRFRYAFE